MIKCLRIVGFFFVVVLGLLLLGIVGVYLNSQYRLNRVYEIPNEEIPISQNSSNVEYGLHIFRFRGCESCHGENLEGKNYLSDPALGDVIASNLTKGKGGVGLAYTNVDWVRAIRHGVRPNGKPLLFMPSTEFYFLDDMDLGAVISYIKSAPPIDHTQAPSSLSFTGREVMAFIKFITFIPAELIPHTASRPVAPTKGITPEYGEYLTYSCKVCHGIKMSGGKIPGFPEGWPSAANLTKSADRYTPYWEKEDFKKILREGITRHGRQINPQYMPWSSYKYMSDLELDAVWAYLQALPQLPFGNR